MNTFEAVVRERRASGDWIELTLDAPGLFSSPVEPGMFVHVAVPDDAARLLRRPVSIMDADERAQTLTLGIRPKGEGTRRIAQSLPGQTLSVLGPMGRGFSLGGAQTVWLAGGGVGVAPLLFAARRYSKQAKVTAVLGFRDQTQVRCPERFSSFAAQVTLCTDDGSAGLCGTVCDGLRCLLPAAPDLILACGPIPMLRAVRDFAQKRRIPCQLSLEERMGCGYGACLTCACAVQSADGAPDYKRVCADGPVFDAEEVLL